MTTLTTKLQEKRWLLFALVYAVYILSTVPMGVVRPLWYDELAARWLAGAPSLSEFTRRVRVGVEPTPPLYLLTQYLFLHVLGVADWTIRVPSMIGYGVALTFLYRFVKRRLGVLGGMTAMAIMLITGDIYYAQEARPYGMILGCVAIAMWCWQQYLEEKRGRFAAFCGLALFAAASLHYYAVLLSVPFGLAELYRIWQRRRIDWKMVPVCAAPGVALLLHYPLIHMIMGEQSNPVYAWSKPTLAFPAKFWTRMLDPGIMVFLGLMLLVLYFWRSRTEGEMAETPSTEEMPGAELALLVGFVLLPVAGTLFAKAVTNAIVPRYVISTMLGFSVLAAQVLTRMTPAPGRIWAFLLLLAAAAGNGALDLRWQLREPAPGQLEIPEVAGEGPLPVVVDDYLLYGQLGQYAKPELLSRLIYLTDVERFPRYTKSGQMELGTVAGIQKGQFGGQAGDLAPFLETHARFLLYEPPIAALNEGWLSRDILDRGHRLRLIAMQGGRWYLVETKAATL